MRFSDTIRPLLLAPLAGVSVFVCEALFRGGPRAIIVGVLTAPFCYAAAAVFVMPMMLLWPKARRPTLPVGAIWGVVTAWGAAAFLAPRFQELERPEVLLGFGITGAASGLLYAYLVKSYAQK